MMSFPFPDPLLIAGAVLCAAIALDCWVHVLFGRCLFRGISP